MRQPAGEAIATPGRVLHGAVGYDLLEWLLTRGRPRRFRQRLLDLARVGSVDRMLDVGCGTGSLAIEAARRVGPQAAVSGIDPSEEMIARARRKAQRAGVNAVFAEAAAERLPFPGGEFDVVTSTLMLHHLPAKTREACAMEIVRVLKPDGRLLVVDFGNPVGARRTLLSHLHRRGHTKIEDVVGLMHDAGLDVVDRGPVGTFNLYFVLAVKSSARRQ